MAIMRTRRIDSRNSRFRRSVPFGLRLLAALLVAAAGCAAQTVDPVETIRVDSDLVDLQVNVLNHDPSRLPVPLQPRDFFVVEDGVPQEITFFAAADAPFDLILLLDLSGSTANKLKLIHRSSERFVEAAPPMDRIAILTFTDVVQIVSPLTYDRGELKKAIRAIQKPEGGTNFWDALRYVFDVVARPGRASRRNAVVVMTDGVDNALPDVFGEGSRTTFEELLNVVRHSNAIVFPIYLDTEDRDSYGGDQARRTYESARKTLGLLAFESGGLYYGARKVEDLNGVYQQVIDDLSRVYSLGYRSTNQQRDSSWRKVNIEIPTHPELKTRARPGYYAK